MNDDDLNREEAAGRAKEAGCQQIAMWILIVLALAILLTVLIGWW